ncbi:MAG: hypothetical protein M3N98_16660 [Actinomycetota bacterium]|nr:hypothetical protein [Actinomycetota bacterium]
MKRAQGLIAAALVLGAGVWSGGVSATASSVGPVAFSAPTFVDTQLAGGEPEVMYSFKYHTFVYTSHRGDTHLDRAGLASTGTAGFVCSTNNLTCNENNVNIWYSNDARTWTVSQESPQYTGFSDPDLTADEAGNIYNTGINLVNDALFSSSDGGKTWPNGTAQCAGGDRPWLAGGKAGEVFLANSTNGHTVFRSTDLGNTCSAGIADPNVYGKLYYDHLDGSLVEPLANGTDLGYTYLANANAAFDSGSGTFVPTTLVRNTPTIQIGGEIALDGNQNMYMTWAPDERQPGTSGGCSGTGGGGGAATPIPNHIYFMAGRRTGPGQWSWGPRVTIYAPANSTSYWPWITAGATGNVSIVWFQTDRVDDLDCDMMNGQVVNENTTIYEAHILNALDPANRTIEVVNASGRVVHSGGVCQSGTTCVATGQDRRMGDFFTNSLDANGCVMIASGDTTQLDQLGQPQPISHPILIRQKSGPSLTGIDCATGQALSASEASTPAPGPSLAPLPTPTAGQSPLPNTRVPGPGPMRGLLVVALACLVVVAMMRRATTLS